MPVAELSASGWKPATSAPPDGRAQREDVEREALAGGGVPLMGTEWRRISSSALGEGCTDARAPPAGAEAKGGSFSQRRLAVVFDSWRKYTPSLATRQPTRKLVAGGALGRAGVRRLRRWLHAEAALAAAVRQRKRACGRRRRGTKGEEAREERLGERHGGDGAARRRIWQPCGWRWRGMGVGFERRWGLASTWPKSNS